MNKQTKDDHDGDKIIIMESFVSSLVKMFSPLIDILIFEAKQKRFHWSELSPNGKLYLVLSGNWNISRLDLKPAMPLLPSLPSSPVI